MELHLLVFLLQMTCAPIILFWVSRVINNQIGCQKYSCCCGSHANTYLLLLIYCISPKMNWLIINTTLKENFTNFQEKLRIFYCMLNILIILTILLLILLPDNVIIFMQPYHIWLENAHLRERRLEHMNSWVELLSCNGANAFNDNMFIDPMFI